MIRTPLLSRSDHRVWRNLLGICIQRYCCCIAETDKFRKNSVFQRSSNHCGLSLILPIVDRKCSVLSCRKLVRIVYHILSRSRIPDTWEVSTQCRVSLYNCPTYNCSSFHRSSCRYSSYCCSSYSSPSRRGSNNVFSHRENNAYYEHLKESKRIRVTENTFKQLERSRPTNTRWDVRGNKSKSLEKAEEFTDNCHHSKQHQENDVARHGWF